MNTRRIRVQRRIVGMSSAEASSWMSEYSQAPRQLGTYRQLMPHLGEGIRNNMQYIDSPAEERHVIVLYMPEVVSASARYEKAPRAVLTLEVERTTRYEALLCRDHLVKEPSSVDKGRMDEGIWRSEKVEQDEVLYGRDLGVLGPPRQSTFCMCLWSDVRCCPLLGKVPVSWCKQRRR